MQDRSIVTKRVGDWNLTSHLDAQSNPLAGRPNIGKGNKRLQLSNGLLGILWQLLSINAFCEKLPSLQILEYCRC